MLPKKTKQKAKNKQKQRTQCSSFISAAVIKYPGPPQKQLKKKGFIWILIHYFREIKQGIKAASHITPHSQEQRK